MRYKYLVVIYYKVKGDGISSYIEFFESFEDDADYALREYIECINRLGFAIIKEKDKTGYKAINKSAIVEITISSC